MQNSHFWYISCALVTLFGVFCGWLKVAMTAYLKRKENKNAE